MKLFLLIACFLLCQSSFAQYKVDTSVRAEYMYLFKKLNKESKIEKNRQFRNGLGILIGSKTDTLNKNDFETLDTSFKIKTINPEPNEPELSPTLSHSKNNKYRTSYTP